MAALALVGPLAVGCGRDDPADVSESPSGSSTSLHHDTAGTIPPPGPSTSELLAVSSSLDVPVLAPGRSGVVAAGRVSDGALVAVVRNMTQEPLADAAVSARRRGEDKGEEVVGLPGVVVPSVLRPGEWGLAVVVLDQPDVDSLEFDISPAGQPRTTLGIQSAGAQAEGVAGTVGNQTAGTVHDVVVDVVCFAESLPVATARLRPVARLGPGATAPFSATIRGRPCRDWAVVASGSAAG